MTELEGKLVDELKADMTLEGTKGESSKEDTAAADNKVQKKITERRENILETL